MSSITAQCLEAKVKDFYHCFAPADIQKSSIALTLGLTSEELFSMLSIKYNVPLANVRTRLRLFDSVARLVEPREHHEFATVTMEILRSIPVRSTYDESTVMQKIASYYSAVGDHGVRRSIDRPGMQASTTVELSPLGLARGTSRDPTPERSAPVPSTSASTIVGSPGRRSGSRAAPTEFLNSPNIQDARMESESVAQAASSLLGQIRGREPVRPGLEDTSLREYHTKLAEVEAVLFQRCMELQLVHENLQAREAEFKLNSDRLRELQETQRIANEETSSRHQRKEVELAESSARIQTEKVHVEESRRKNAELQRSHEQSLRSLEEREAKLAAATQALASREAAVASQIKLVDQERLLCQRLSAEVLKRETTVRGVEKSLATVKSELVRLEDDLNTRAKQLLDDEASVRRWAAELEKKDLTVQSIFEQLRHKGIHVSF